MAFMSNKLFESQITQSIMNTHGEQYPMSTIPSSRPLCRPMLDSPRDEVDETGEKTATKSANKRVFITMYEAKRLKLEKTEDGGDSNGINSLAMRESRRTFNVNEQIGQLRTLLQDADFPLPPTASKYHVLQSCEKYIQQLVTRSNQMETNVKPPFFGVSTASSNFGNLSLESESSTIRITSTFQGSARKSNSSLCSDEQSHQTCNDNHADQPPKDGYVDDTITNNNNDIHDNKYNIKSNINHNNTTITKKDDIITTTNNSSPNTDLVDYEHILESSC